MLALRGLALLLLNWAPLQAAVGAAAAPLLQHLSLLFVPVGVGVVTHVALLAQYGLRIVAVLVVSTLSGLTATLAVYVSAQAVYGRLEQAPWANPVLWTVIVLGGLLMATGTAYPSYFAGAAAAGSAVLTGWALGLPPDVLASLAPKSVTAPVAMGIAEQLGGIPALAAVLAVLTGLVGAVGAKPLFDALRITRPEARGFALGTASHGIGAARALQVHPVAGAYAALALGLQVVLGALLLPLADPALLPLLLSATP